MRFAKTGMLAMGALALVVAASVPASAAPRGHGGFHGGGGARVGGFGGGGFRGGSFAPRANFAARTNFVPRANFAARTGSARFVANSGWRNQGGRWRGGDWRYRRHYGGFGLGFATGALLGSAPYWGSWGPYAYDDYAYYDDGYGYDGGYVTAASGDVQYCMQRFKSYDPASGTYLGYDGVRHPCP
jgi:hypothetical protein